MKKNNSILLTSLFLMLITMSSCQAIGDIFKAGIWVGVIIVALIIGLIFWLVGRSK